MRESERMGVEYSLHDGVKGREERKWVKISHSACMRLKYPYT